MDGQEKSDVQFSIQHGSVPPVGKRSGGARKSDSGHPLAQPDAACERIRRSSGDPQDGKLPDAERVGQVFRIEGDIGYFPFPTERGKAHAGAIERDDANSQIVRDAAGKGRFQPRSGQAVEVEDRPAVRVSVLRRSESPADGKQGTLAVNRSFYPGGHEGLTIS